MIRRDISPKMIYKWPVSTKTCLTKLVIREIKIKAMRHHFTYPRMSKIRKLDSNECWQRCGARGLSYIAFGN